MSVRYARMRDGPVQSQTVMPHSQNITWARRGHELFQWIFDSSVVRTKKGVTAVTTKKRFYCSVLLLTKVTPLLAHKITSQSHVTFTITAENCCLSVSHGKSKNCQILQFWNVKFCMKYQEFQSSWKLSDTSPIREKYHF
jgi:hypothetical protein